MRYRPPLWGEAYIGRLASARLMASLQSTRCNTHNMRNSVATRPIAPVQSSKEATGASQSWLALASGWKTPRQYNSGLSVEIRVAERPEQGGMLQGAEAGKVSHDPVPRADAKHEQHCAPLYDKTTTVSFLCNKTHGGRVLRADVMLLGRPHKKARAFGHNPKDPATYN